MTRADLLKVSLVGLGGFLGSTFRFAMTGWMHRVVPLGLFPVGTFAVNLLGCFAVGGLLGGFVELRQVMSPELRHIGVDRVPGRIYDLFGVRRREPRADAGRRCHQSPGQSRRAGRSGARGSLARLLAFQNALGGKNIPSRDEEPSFASSLEAGRGHGARFR